MGWWTSRSMSTSAWTRVSAHLRIPCVEHSGPGRNGVPWARAAYGGASRQGPHRTAAPLSPSGWIPSCTFSGWQCPAACRGDRFRPDLLTSRRRPPPRRLSGSRQRHWWLPRRIFAFFRGGPHAQYCWLPYEQIFSPGSSGPSSPTRTLPKMIRLRSTVLVPAQDAASMRFAHPVPV